MSNERRPAHFRQPPLEHAAPMAFAGADDGSLLVYAAPGHLLFIERMCHGDYQQIPVDPTEIEDLVRALEVAGGYAMAETRESGSDEG